MSTLTEILEYLVASEEIDKLPTATSLPTDGWLAFYNPNTQQTEKIAAANIGGVANGWKWIEASFVEKDAGNTDNTLLEVNDVVWFKSITNAATDYMVLVGYTYDGGDKDLIGSYTQNNQILT